MSTFCNPLFHIHLLLLTGDLLSNATGERIAPTATSSCACSHEVSEVTLLSTVYITSCSSMDAPFSYHPRQPPILTTAPNTKSDNINTGSLAVSTVPHQDSSASLANIRSLQPRQTTHSPNQLHPTPVPPLGNTIGDPHATGSAETTVTQSMRRGETSYLYGC